MMCAMWMYFVILASPLSGSDPINADWESPQNGKCRLPEYPAYGVFTTNLPDAKPREAFDSVTIYIACGQGFEVEGSNPVRCRNGSWENKLPKCILITHCHLPLHSSIDYYCEEPKGSRVCDEYVPVGTLVSPQCRNPMYYSLTSSFHMWCNESNWSYNAKCILSSAASPFSARGIDADDSQRPFFWRLMQMGIDDRKRKTRVRFPLDVTTQRVWKVGVEDKDKAAFPNTPYECGVVTTAGTTLIINGVTAKPTEVPWHAGIYTRTTNPYQQICGGSLIRNNIVISAAHCFWSDTVGQLPATNYAVAVGKLYRPWIDTRDEAQETDVKELHLTDHFQGSAANFQNDIAVVIVMDPFEYTAHIRPVCLDFDFNFQESQLTIGNKGKVAGWGLSAENGDPSQELKVIDLPYITTKQCISESRADFRAYITSDKMCAGYKDAGKALCKGDSGGGLAFPGTKDKDIERYYLRGIVSTSPNSNNLCNSNSFTTFTLLLEHEHFLKYWLAEMATRKTNSGGGARVRPVNRNVMRTFVDRAASPPAPFQHLTVDRNTGHVYIGALNRIHQLTSDLERTQWIVTGPVEESKPCFSACPANLPLELKDNTNKILVIDYVTSRLITCGTIFQGMCSVRNLKNISMDVREVQKQVVGHDAALSTVAFIAPGPPYPPMTHVLYVGTIYSDTYGGSYFNYIPHVGSYSLENDRLFMDAVMKENTITSTTLHRHNYPQNFIYGFSSKGFSYFLTLLFFKTQLFGKRYGYYYSKLVRVCQNDNYYYSYTEIPISCTAKSFDKYTTYRLVQAAYVGKAGPTLAAELGVTTQDDVLFAVFSKSELFNTNKPSNQSALCIYSLEAIRQIFTQTIKKCFMGIGVRGKDLSSSNSSRCVAMKFQIDDDFCGLKLNSPLLGELPVEAVPAALFDTQLTAVAATTTGDHTVVFVGTANGYLKKILVDNLSSAFEYGEIDIGEGSPINKDLIFDTQRTHLYVMTKRSVSKVRVQECYEYKSCYECLGAKDPHCGWSLLENECTLRTDGQNATQNSPQWISYQSGRCPTITEVIPNQLQRATPMTLELFIENLPTYKRQFACAFTAFGHTVVTNATRTSSGVSCDPPRTDKLPSVPESQHHFTARLSVRTAQGSDVVATEFKFFDCNTYSSCTQCVTSPFPCDWCLDGNRCTHDVGGNCRNDVLVISALNRTNSYHSGSSFCPAVNSTSTSEILVPFGVKKTIELKVIIRSLLVLQSRFVCQFSVEGRVIHVNGQLLGDTVYCDSVEFMYTSLAPYVTASLAVTWGRSKTLDNPGNTHILIYRCSGMAANCDECLAWSEKFDCGWCQGAGTDKCEMQDLCEAEAPKSWLNRTLTCPVASQFSGATSAGYIGSELIWREAAADKSTKLIILFTYFIIFYFIF